MERRTPVTIRLLLGSLLLATMLASWPAAAQPLRVRAAYSALSGSHALLWIAKESGTFQRYGLDVPLLFIQGGTISTSSLISGQIAFVQIGADPIITARLQGADTVLVAGIVNKLAFHLIAAKEITRAEQLKGKRIGIQRPGDSVETAARFALQGAGLDPDRDVSFRLIGGQPTRFAALKAGSIEGTPLLPPFTLTAQKEGFHDLLDLSTLPQDYQVTAIAATSSYLKASRDTALRFMKGLVAGIQYYKSHRAESERIIARYLQTQDMAAVAESYRVFGLNLLAKKPYPSVEGVRAILTNVAKTMPQAARVDPQTFIDNSLLKELDDSGFIDGLYR